MEKDRNEKKKVQILYVEMLRTNSLCVVIIAKTKATSLLENWSMESTEHLVITSDSLIHINWNFTFYDTDPCSLVA